MEHDEHYCEKCPLNNFCSAQREDDLIEGSKIDISKSPDASRLPLCKKCPFKKGEKDIVLVIPISMN